MSFKEWSSAHSAPATVKPADKSKDASQANKPVKQPGLTQTLTINPNELDAALERDQAQLMSPFGSELGQEVPKARRHYCGKEGAQLVSPFGAEYGQEVPKVRRHSRGKEGLSDEHE